MATGLEEARCGDPKLLPDTWAVHAGEELSMLELMARR